MIAILILAVTTPTAQDDPVPDYRGLVSVMRQANPITDMSFMFEGSNEYMENEHGSLGPGDSYDFQGTYRYRVERDPTSGRVNPAGFLDAYRWKSDGTRALEHDTHAVLDGTHYLVLNFPDRQPSPETVQESPADRNSLLTAASPEEVLRHIEFDGWTADNEEFSNYVKVEGWEAISGRKCLRFVIDGQLGTEQEGSNHERYWMDLERGAHVMKHESFMDRHLAGRIDDVRLEQVGVIDDREVWFPVEAHYYSYLTGIDEFSDEPVIHMTYHFVRETIRINQGLPDSQFNVFRRPGVDQSESLRRLEREYRSQAEAPATFEEVQERLESNLAMANRQSEELEASSAARNPSLSSYSHYGLFALGVVLLSITGVLILRR